MSCLVCPLQAIVDCTSSSLDTTDGGVRNIRAAPPHLTDNESYHKIFQLFIEFLMQVHFYATTVMSVGTVG